jgi:hypothetical protein
VQSRPGFGSTFNVVISRYYPTFSNNGHSAAALELAESN